MRWREKKKTLLALLSADMSLSWTAEIHLGLHCRIKVQRLSFCPWTKCPRWAACAEYILLPAGHTCIQQDSSASSPSSTRPVKHQVRLHYTAIYSSNQSVFSAIIRKQMELYEWSSKRNDIHLINSSAMSHSKHTTCSHRLTQTHLVCSGGTSFFPLYLPLTGSHSKARNDSYDPLLRHRDTASVNLYLGGGAAGPLWGRDPTACVLFRAAEFPCEVTRYILGLRPNHSAQRDGGVEDVPALLLACSGLHVAAVALRAAVLVVGAANRLEDRGRRRNRRFRLSCWRVLTMGWFFLF